MAASAAILRQCGNGAAEGEDCPGQQRWQSRFTKKSEQFVFHLNASRTCTLPKGIPSAKSNLLITGSLQVPDRGESSRIPPPWL
jgi:hypothetical protein